MQENRSAFGPFVLIVIGLIFLIGPAFIPSEVISSGSSWMISVLGIVVLIIGAILWLLTKLYIKTPANEAFIRTGMGGQKVIIDGGAIFIGLFHELKRVYLETMKLIVSRTGKESIITKDKLRADLTAEFYIKIPKTKEGVTNAATSLGDRGMKPENVKQLVEEKLISALRTVGAKSTLAQLHEDREAFATAVFEQVKKDLESNGLELESVTISRLDQSSLESFDPNNVFDAEGARTVAEITSKLNVERNAFEKKAEQQIGQENLSTQKILDAQKVEQEESAAERNKNVTVLQASKTREATEKAEEERQKSEAARILADQKIGELEAAKQKTVETANVEAEKEIQLKTIDKQEAEAVANENKQKAVETAQIDRQITVLNKQKEQAAADEARNLAEAKAKKAEEQVKTVQVVETANRDKQKAVITEEAKAETVKINENAKADIKAYETKTIAAADKEAAQNRAEAVTVEAEADLKKKKLNAEGDTAVQMVPVLVNEKQVEVNGKQVEVTGKELKYKAEFEKISVTLETTLASITAEKEVGIAMAQGMATAYANANMNIWGDGNTAAQMMKVFSEGQGTFFKLKALGDGGDAKIQPREEAKALIADYLSGLKTAMEIQGAADNVSSEIKSLVQEFVKSGGGNTLTGIGLMIKSLTGKDATTADLAKVEDLVSKL